MRHLDAIKEVEDMNLSSNFKNSLELRTGIHPRKFGVYSENFLKYMLIKINGSTSANSLLASG